MRLPALALIFALFAGCGPGTLELASHQTQLYVGQSTALIVTVTPRRHAVVSLSATGSGVVADPRLELADGEGVTQLTASSAGTVTVTATLDGVSSTTDVIFLPTTTLRFTTSPSNTVAQNLLRPIPTVVVEDNGATVTSWATEIRVAIEPGSCSATLDASSLATATPSQGTASFPGLKSSTPATGCRLSATSGGLSASSASFDIL